MEREGDNPSSFAIKLTSNRQTVGNIIAGVNKPSYDFMLLLLKVFPDLSFDWLINGKGEPFHNSAPPMQVVRDSSMPKVVTVDSSGDENILYVPIPARAGYLSGYGDPEYIEHVEAYRLPNLKNGTYRMFQVEGQSMYPTLKHGDIVVAEWVESIDDIRDERVHVLVTKQDGIVIKRAINAANKLGSVIAKSDNTNKGEYPNIEVRPNDIKEIWYARGFFSYSFASPSDTYIRLTNVEVELEAMKKAVQKILNQ